MGQVPLQSQFFFVQTQTIICSCVFSFYNVGLYTDLSTSLSIRQATELLAPSEENVVDKAVLFIQTGSVSILGRKMYDEEKT